MKNRIRELREEYKLTQTDLASKLNLSKPTISKYEDGSVDMSTETLQACSKIFNCSIDYLLYQDNIRKRSDQDLPDKLKEDPKAYNRAFKLAQDCHVTPEQIEEQLLLWKKMKKN